MNHTRVQNTFCSLEYFLQLDIVRLFVKATTWLIFALNINQSTFGTARDGIIWTPVRMQYTIHIPESTRTK